MKTADPALVNLLHTSDKFHKVDLYTITLTDGTIIRYTTADIKLTVGGNVYKAEEALFQRGKVKWTVGLDVDELDITVYANDNDKVLDIPILKALRFGTFDDAILQLDLMFLPNWSDTSIPPLSHFTGRIAIDEASMSYVKMKVRSETELLNIDMPYHVHQPACLHALYQTGCDVSKAGKQVNGSVLAGSTQSLIKCSFAQAEGYFDLGFIYFTNGPNMGVRRTVRSYTPGNLQLVYPLFTTPSIGNTFIAYPGCDKKKDTCSSKYNNLTHFRGYPYVPTPETIY